MSLAAASLNARRDGRATLARSAADGIERGRAYNTFMARSAVLVTLVGALVGLTVVVSGVSGVSGVSRASSIHGAHDDASQRPAGVLVELFTSEGCSSCPPADSLLQSLADTQPIGGAEIIALGQHVDYWDQLGWKDRFSSAALTDRQRQYAHALGIDGIYTPQMVVDGREGFVGSDASQARRAIGKALSARHAAVSIALEEMTGANRFAVTVRIEDVPPISASEHLDLGLAVTEDRLRSDVRSGENRGRQLTHAAVVRHLDIVRAQGPALEPAVRIETAIAPGWERDRLKIVAFIQERVSRRVLGTAAVALPSAPR